MCRQQHLESSLPPSVVPAPPAWIFHHYPVSRFQLMERSCSWVWEGSLYLLMDGGSSRGQIHPVAHHVIFTLGCRGLFTGLQNLSSQELSPDLRLQVLCLFGNVDARISPSSMISRLLTSSLAVLLLTPRLWWKSER